MKDLRRPTQDLNHFKREITDALGKEITIRKGGKKTGLNYKMEGRKVGSSYSVISMVPGGPWAFVNAIYQNTPELFSFC